MVLENASAAAAPDSFEDGPPPSDDDPYASSKSGTYTIGGRGMPTYSINRNNIPKLLPILEYLPGYTPQTFDKAVSDRITAASQAVHRPLTQDEVDVFVFYTARGFSTASLGIPTGVSAGLWKCYRTAKTFQFPFFKGQNMETFNPRIFPPALPGIPSLLTGSRAVILWHALRALTYSSAGCLIGQTIFGLYGSIATVYGELTDSRLRPYHIAQRAELHKRRGGLETGMGKSQPQDANGSGDNQQESRDEPDWSKTQAERLPPQTQLGPRRPFKPVEMQEQVQASSDQAFEMFDEASPTGGQGVQADARAAPVAVPGGSAWDRVRRGERGERGTGTGQGGRSAWQKRQDESWHTQGNDSFAFSKTEEENSYAKDQGLKEFQALVERERTGSDSRNRDGAERRW
ncbi:hypothetical protein PZA11_004778 [Diplocarpon coronariae]|nr:hypothetical protein JHW43_003434 [Diplocarpon mali]